MIEVEAIDKTGSKQQQYEQLLLQVKAITQGESDLIANLSNICALLKHEMHWFWVGFYFVKGDELVLGPFQGPLACTRIQKGKGVCGTSWEQNATIVVPDVHQFEGHIACSSLTQSEIVLPIIDAEKKCLGVLDVDSEYLNTFDEEDRQGLERIINLIVALF
ncbi:MAG: GAF domain-containing protein [Flavobacteriales bacterium]|nr:GAF domain-containing protein [Flavobacteriales bacterium]